MTILPLNFSIIYTSLSLLLWNQTSPKGPFGYGKESGEMESERVKMEIRVKLGNDEKVKFVGPRKNVRWREKTCGSRDICKLQKTH